MLRRKLSSTSLTPQRRLLSNPQLEVLELRRLLSVNTPPVANPDLATTDEVSPITVDVLSNDTDVDLGDDPTTFSLDQAVIRPATDSLVQIDIDNSQMQGGKRRVYPQLPTAEQLFPLDGSSFDYTFQFTEAEYLESSQDFRYSLVIFMESSTSISNETFGFDAEWDFLDANGVPVYSYTGGKVSVRTTAGIPQLRISGSDMNEVSDYAPSGMPFYGIRLAATLPDLISQAPDVRVQSPNPALQDGAEFSLNGSSSGAWSIGQGTATGPWDIASDRGAVSIVNNQLVFDPGTDFLALNQGEFAEVVVDYVMSDDEGAPSTSTATITVDGVSTPNTAPVANPDVGTVDENAVAVIDVLANDTDVDPGDDPTTFSLDTVSIVTPNSGSVTIVNNQLQFDPSGDFDALNDGDVANVVIDYTMSDDEGASASSTATITVSGIQVNSAPVANPDVASTDKLSSILVDVLANDTDADAGDDPATFSLDEATIRSASNATVQIDIDNWQMQGGKRRVYPQLPTAEQLFPLDGSSFDYTFQFTEAEYLESSQDFRYSLVIFMESSTSISNETFGFDAEWDFLDADGLPVYSYTGGKVSVRTTAGIPQLRISGSDINEVSDYAPSGMPFYGIRLAATLPDLISQAPDVRVQSPNPALQDGAEFSLNGSSSGAWSIGQGASSGPWGGSVGLGTASIVGNQLLFDPGTDFGDLQNGQSQDVIVDYVMSDDEGASSSSTATITVNGSPGSGNQSPTANPDFANTDEASLVTVDVLANDTDPDAGDDPTTFSLDFASIVGANNGSVTIINNQLQFDPGSDFVSLQQGQSADVVVNYTMSDDEGATALSTATITVAGIGVTNSPPVANPDTAVTDEATPILVDVLANDTDPDVGDEPATFTIDSVSIRPSQSGTIVPIDVDESQMIGGTRRIYPPIPNADQLFPVTGGSIDYTFKFTEMQYLEASQAFSYGLSIALNSSSSLGNEVFNQDVLWQFVDADNSPVHTFAGGQVATQRRSSDLVLRNVDVNGVADIGPSGLQFYGIRIVADLPDLVSQYLDVTVNPTNVDFALSGTASGGTWSIETGVDVPSGSGDGGVVSVVSNQLHFDPNGDFDALGAGESATVVIDYTMSDDEGSSASSIATITVNGVGAMAAAVAVQATDAVFADPVNLLTSSPSMGDIDGDGQVGFSDFLILSANYDTVADEVGRDGDLNSDGAIDFGDFLLLSRYFGE